MPQQSLINPHNPADDQYTYAVRLDRKILAKMITLAEVIDFIKSHAKENGNQINQYRVKAWQF